MSAQSSSASSTSDHQASSSHSEGRRSLVDALAELSTVILGQETLASLLDRLSRITKSMLPGVVGVSVTLVEGGRPTTAAFTNDVATALDERQYGTGHGPCLDAVHSAATVVISDMATETRWPKFTPDASARGVGSVLSIPLPLQQEFIGGINIYGGQPALFDPATIALAETFASYGAVAVANTQRHEASARLAEQMKEAMASRAVIEQAKGVIMASRRCSPEEAFDVLRKASQDGNRKLRDLAQALVHDASTPLRER